VQLWEELLAVDLDGAIVLRQGDLEELHNEWVSASFASAQRRITYQIVVTKVQRPFAINKSVVRTVVASYLRRVQ
jgi:hypothetical protein